MDIRTKNALMVLGIKDCDITRSCVKAAYQRMASKYHPDKNPHGLQIMQNINIAYDHLTHLPKHEYPLHQEPYQGGLKMMKHGGKIIVSGNTYNNRAYLKSEGYKWCPVKKIWWRPI
jgi:DnaJ-class molecular chaperone